MVVISWQSPIASMSFVFYALAEPVAHRYQRSAFTMTKSHSQNSWAVGRRALRGVVLLLSVCLLAGCSSESELRLEDYLEEIEYDVPLDSSVEVSMGQYSIPIAARPGGIGRTSNKITWVQLKFDMYAVLNPIEKSEFEDAWQRSQGMFHDEVIEVCRNATLDEIADSRITTIKSRMTEVAKSIFGENRIRQLLCTNIVTEPI